MAFNVERRGRKSAKRRNVDGPLSQPTGEVSRLAPRNLPGLQDYWPLINSTGSSGQAVSFPPSIASRSLSESSSGTFSPFSTTITPSACDGTGEATCLIRRNIPRQGLLPSLNPTDSSIQGGFSPPAGPSDPTSNSGVTPGFPSQSAPILDSSSSSPTSSSASSDTTTPPSSSPATSSSDSTTSPPPTQQSTSSSSPSSTPSSTPSSSPSHSSSNASTSSSPHASSSGISSPPSPTATSTPPSNSQSSTSSAQPTPPPTSSSGGGGSSSSSSGGGGGAGSTVMVTSEIVFSSNGVAVSTMYTTFPSVLSAPVSSGMSHATRNAVVIGSVVGGVAFLGLLFALVFFYRRHQYKKLNFFSRDALPRRSMLLAGEDIDDYDLGPRMHAYQDYPSSIGSRAQSYSHAPSPLPDVAMVARNTPSPHLMGLRASESGSIFQEAVWPPPKALVDPLVPEMDDLGRIVDDVMGPSPNAAVSGMDAGAGIGATASASTSTLPRTPRALHRPTSSDDSSVSGHGRSASQTALLPPDSPGSPTFPRSAPLFVTNMGSGHTSPTPPNSPPAVGRGTRWLDRTPRKAAEELPEVDEGGFIMGEAL